MRFLIRTLFALLIPAALLADGPLSSSSFRSPVTITAGNVATNKPPIDVTATWTVSTNTYTGLRYNVTDSGSASGSLLLDLQVGGSSKLSVVKTGKILGNGANPFLFLDQSVGSQLGYGTGILNNGGSSLTWSAGGTEVARVDNTGLVSVASGGGYQFSSTAVSSGTKDLILVRDAAGILAQRNGANAQGFRVYKTFTDASTYERGTFDFTTTAGTLTIGSQKGVGGTLAPVTLTGQDTTVTAVGNLVLSSSTGGSGATYFNSNNSTRWFLNLSGHFIPNADASFDIGASGNSVRLLYLSKTVTAAGTTGAQTINRASGSVNLAAGATSLVVTDSLVTTSSIIVLTVAANDATCKSVAYVPGSGSFTIYPNAAPTSETRINFVVASP